MSGVDAAVVHVGVIICVSAALISIVVGTLDAVVVFGTVVCVRPIANAGTLDAVMQLGIVTSVRAASISLTKAG